MNDLSVFAKDAAQAVDMRQAFAAYGIDVDRAGFALCPFHNEDTPSLKVYDRSFYCFGCGVGGDVVDLVRRLFDLSFRDALEKINLDFCLGFPFGERITIRRQREMQKRRDELRRQKAETERRNRERYDRYLDLLGQWEDTVTILREFRPKPADESLHPLFASALKKFEPMNFEINNFDWR